MIKPLPFTATLIATLLLSACSDTLVLTEPDGVQDAQDVNGEPDTQGLAAEARLKTFDNSETFYAALREALINSPNPYGGQPDIVLPIQISVEANAPTAESASDEQAPTATGSGNEVTSTNVQEAGVDEQDRVKVNADGTQLYVLSTDANYLGFPVIAISTEDQAPGGTEPSVEPSMVSPIPSQDTLHSTLRILSLDPETPDATSINEVAIDLGGRFADGFYLFEDSEQSSAIVTASGNGYWGYWNQSAAFSGLQSVIAKVDVTDAANAALSESLTIDGQIISSRRIGDSLFFASRYYPTVVPAQPWAFSAEDWRSAVESADLANLMPKISHSGANVTTELTQPATCFVAPGADSQSYYSPDIITLGVIDLSTMQLQDSECFLGATETLYANPDAVYLATTRHEYSAGPVTTTGELIDIDADILPTDFEWSDPRTTTDIHKFTIQGNQLAYDGSGSVPGHLGWSNLQKPFRMSDSNGVLRVATMNFQQGPEHSPILLNILESDGEGNLNTIGKLPNADKPAHIGKPGERLYASRFLGDRGYLVTFRQIDPLYIIDLSTPHDPQILGELEITGYSDYLHPIGENHLLGIGKDAIAASDGQGDQGGAWVQGIKLSLFDVSNPSVPTEVDSVLVGQRGTNAAALRNHRAITVQSATDSHPTRVSFGINVYGEADPTGSPEFAQAWQSAPWNYTGLHGFEIITGANASISSRGALVVDQATGSNGYSRFSGDDRSVMVNDAVFYINGTTVFPAHWDNLEVTPQAR